MEAADAAAAMTEHTNEILIGHVALFVTTMIGIMYQVYRENRAHRWQLEDREYQRQHREEQTEEVISRIDAQAPRPAIRRADITAVMELRHDEATAAHPSDQHRRLTDGARS